MLNSELVFVPQKANLLGPGALSLLTSRCFFPLFQDRSYEVIGFMGVRWPGIETVFAFFADLEKNVSIS